MKSVEKANERLKGLNFEHGYSENWIIDVSGVEEMKTGFTKNGEKILGFFSVGLGRRFYVEQKLSNEHTICVVITKKEVGDSAVQAYLKSEDKVDLKKLSRKYYKGDAERCGDIIHVACKQVKTRKISESKDESNKQRMPPTKVLLYFDKKKTWMNWSDLVVMHGKEEARDLIENYYDVRDISYL